MIPKIVDQRCVVRTSPTLSWQPVDADGEPVDPGGTVTVTVVASDGSVLVEDASTSGTGSAPRTRVLGMSATAELDLLTATWSVDGTAAGVTTLAVDGKVFASIAQIRGREPAIADTGRYPASAIAGARRRVEELFERACGVAFVPRFEVEELRGSGAASLVLGWPELRRVRWARVDGEELSSSVVESIAADAAGVARRRDGGVWPRSARVEVAYEHGYDGLAADGLRHFARCVRVDLNEPQSAIPDRAVSFQPVEGGNVVLATPGVRDWVTGIPTVDEWLMRHRRTVPAVA